MNERKESQAVLCHESGEVVGRSEVGGAFVFTQAGVRDWRGSRLAEV